jgi:dTDP-4-dehydrorhamnose reductase
MLKLLLFGRTGQIGWELERSLGLIGRVTALGRRDTDLFDASAVERCIESMRPDVVVNAAAFTNVDDAETNESAAFAINAEAPRAMARAASSVGALLVHYSTDYVFDGSNKGEWAEHAEPAPLNAYGRSKLAGERAIQESGCNHLLLRTSWIYGARGKNFLLAILQRALDGDSLTVVDDQIGAPTSARFVAEATCHLVPKAMQVARATSCRPRIAEVINVACAGSTTWHGFANRVVDAMRGGLSIAIPPIERTSTELLGRPALRPRNSVLNLERLRDRWGIQTPQWDQTCDLIVAEVMESRQFRPMRRAPR